MRRPRLFLFLGLALAVLLALTIGTRPSLKAQQSPPAIATTFVGGAFGDGAEVEPVRTYTPVLPMSIAETKTRLKLNDKITLNFPTDSPLSDVVKYLKETTVDKADFPEGLPIYVDPIGLQDADKTTASTVVIELKGIPLATTLKLLLEQLSLTYWVNSDGLVIITANTSENVPVNSADLIVEKLSIIQREVMTLRSEVRILRGLPPGGAPMGSVGGSMGGSGGGMR